MKWFIQRLAEPSTLAGFAVVFQLADQFLYGGASVSLDVGSLAAAFGAMVKPESPAKK